MPSNVSTFPFRVKCRRGLLRVVVTNDVSVTAPGMGSLLYKDGYGRCLSPKLTTSRFWCCSGMSLHSVLYRHSLLVFTWVVRSIP